MPHLFWIPGTSYRTIERRKSFKTFILAMHCTNLNAAFSCIGYTIMTICYSCMCNLTVLSHEGHNFRLNNHENRYLSNACIIKQENWSFKICNMWHSNRKQLANSFCNPKGSKYRKHGSNSILSHSVELHWWKEKSWPCNKTSTQRVSNK